MPWAPCVNALTVSVSPFGSVSFESTLTAPGVAAFVVSVSSNASGVKIALPPTLPKAKMNVFGVPSVGPSSVLGWPNEYTSAPTAFTVCSASISVPAAP